MFWEDATYCRAGIFVRIIVSYLRAGLRANSLRKRDAWRELSGQSCGVLGGMFWEDATYCRAGIFVRIIVSYLRAGLGANSLRKRDAWRELNGQSCGVLGVVQTLGSLCEVAHPLSVVRSFLESKILDIVGELL